MLRKILAFFLGILLLVTIGFATEIPYANELSGVLEQQGEALDDKLPPSVKEMLPEVQNGIEETVKAATPQNLFQKIISQIRTYMVSPIKMFVSLLGIMLISCLLEVFTSSLSSTGCRSIFQITVCVAVATMIAQPVVERIAETAMVIHDFSLFLATYIPIFAGVVTASGQPLTASAYNIFLFSVCQLVAQLISKYFVPLLCAYLAISIITVVSPPLKLDGIVKGIKSFIIWGLTLTLTLFVGLLSVQTAIAYNGDNVTVKAAKFMIGSLVPGIGGALSDLFVAAQGCIQLAKGTLGAFGVVVTLFTFLPMLIKILLWYAALSITSFVGTILGTDSISQLAKNISGTLGILLAVLLYDALLVIISTTMIIVSFKVV